MPAVLTIQLGINTPRYASLRSIKQAAAKPIELIGLADLAHRGRRRRIGIAVARAAHVRARQGTRAIDRGQRGRAGAAARAIIREFKERPHERHLVIAEQRRGELRPITLELIGAAQRLRRDGEKSPSPSWPIPRNLPLR
jgi:hypothetical protein